MFNLSSLLCGDVECDLASPGSDRQQTGHCRSGLNRQCGPCRGSNGLENEVQHGEKLLAGVFGSGWFVGCFVGYSARKTGRSDVHSGLLETESGSVSLARGRRFWPARGHRFPGSTFRRGQSVTSSLWHRGSTGRELSSLPQRFPPSASEIQNWPACWTRRPVGCPPWWQTLAESRSPLEPCRQASRY